jgi:hemoglobin
MAKHLPRSVDAEQFDLWLALFENTAHEVCPPEAAQHFVERARRIAASLELGIAGLHGVRLGVLNDSGEQSIPFTTGRPRRSA